MIYYDLHIHSCLSSCADDDMTPNNVINMALLKELEVIAITDHNTTLNLEAFSKVAQDKIEFVYGVEIESIEGVHLLGLFKTNQKLNEVQNWLESSLIKTDNNPAYFGNQFIRDENDEVIDEYPYLLISSTNKNVNQISEFIHSMGGVVVIAHALDRANSIITQLGFIPKELKFDAIEVKSYEQKDIILQSHPWIEDTVWLFNSDAHQLIDINENDIKLSDQSWEKLWRSTDL